MKTFFIIVGCILAGLLGLLIALWIVVGIISAVQILIDTIRGY